MLLKSSYMDHYNFNRNDFLNADYCIGLFSRSGLYCST